MKKIRYEKIKKPIIKTIKIEKTVFICDNEDCKKEQSYDDDNNEYPYSMGWVFLYNFEFKVASNCSNPNKLKHFCCRNCMVKRIKRTYI